MSFTSVGGSRRRAGMGAGIMGAGMASIGRLVITIAAVDHASRIFFRVGKSVGSLRQQFKEFGSFATLAFSMISSAALASAADFEGAMARLGAKLGVVSQSLEHLAVQTKYLAQISGFSATEIADAMSELAAQGFTVSEITEGIVPLTMMATAGFMDMATASDYATSILRAFGFEISKLSYVSDVLAKQDADTNAAIADTAEALKYSSAIARTAGISFEELTAAIGFLANMGIKGSMAGTSLRGVIAALTNPSAEAQKILHDLGIELEDDEGNMRGLADIVEQFNTAMEGMSEVEKTRILFEVFNRRAAPAFAALMHIGAEELKNYTEELKKAGGQTQTMATIQMWNLYGSLVRVQNAANNLSITLGRDLYPKIAGVIEGITNWLNTMAITNPWLLGWINNIIILTSALFALGVAIPPIIGIIKGMIAVVVKLSRAIMGEAAARSANTAAASAEATVLAANTAARTANAAASTAAGGAAGVRQFIDYGYDLAEWGIPSITTGAAGTSAVVGGTKAFAPAVGVAPSGFALGGLATAGIVAALAALAAIVDTAIGKWFWHQTGLGQWEAYRRGDYATGAYLGMEQYMDQVIHYLTEKVGGLGESFLSMAGIFTSTEAFVTTALYGVASGLLDLGKTAEWVNNVWLPSARNKAQENPALGWLGVVGIWQYSPLAAMLAAENLGLASRESIGQAFTGALLASILLGKPLYGDPWDTDVPRSGETVINITVNEAEHGIKTADEVLRKLERRLYKKMRNS